MTKTDQSCYKDGLQQPKTVTTRIANTFIAKIVLIIFLNIFDLVSTFWLIRHGAAEANPIMATVLESGNATFVLVKIMAIAAFSIITLFAASSSKSQERRFANLATNVVLLVYSALFTWHCYLIYAIQLV